MTPKEKRRFDEGEKILCFQGSLIYEAKVLKVSTKTKNNRLYLVHYNGWKKKWDEWVTQARVLKYTPQNLDRQKCLSDQQRALAKYHRAPPFLLGRKKRQESLTNSKKDDGRDAKSPVEPSAKGSSSSSKPSAADAAVGANDENSKDAHQQQQSQPSSDGKRRRREAAISACDAIRRSVTSPVPPQDASAKAEKPVQKRKTEGESDAKPAKKPRKNPNFPTVEDEEQWLNTVEIEVPLSSAAKALLFRDWENVHEQQMIFHLPVRVPVTEIFSSWAKSDTGGTSGKRLAQRGEFMESVKDYFNAMLPNHLLYDFEKPHHQQFKEKHPGKPVCEIYGAVHLLRMFTKIGQMLAYTNLDRHCSKFFALLLGELSEFVVANFQKFSGFQDCYLAPAAYTRKF